VKRCQFCVMCCTLSGANSTGVHVLDPGEGVCADPVNGGAILGKGEPDPQGGNKERQLSPDKGRDKTYVVELFISFRHI
jgi:hypothetical protein